MISVAIQLIPSIFNLTELSFYLVYKTNKKSK